MPICKFDGWLPVKGYIDRGLVEFIIQSDHPVNAYAGMAVVIVILVVVMMVVIVCTNMCAWSDIPFETWRSGNRAMNFVETRQAKAMAVEIANQLTRMTAIEKML